MDRGTRQHASFVSLGDREGFNKALRNSALKSPKHRPLLMIVQRDGGEIRVERLQRGYYMDRLCRWIERSFVDTVVYLFEQFEVQVCFFGPPSSCHAGHFFPNPSPSVFLQLRP